MWMGLNIHMYMYIHVLLSYTTYRGDGGTVTIMYFHIGHEVLLHE